MIKKNGAKGLANLIKNILGKHDGAYHFVKKVGYVFISLSRAVGMLSPRNLAYYLFPVNTGSYAGYVTRADLRGFSGVVFRANGAPPGEVELIIDGVTVNRTFASQKVQHPSKYAGTSDGFYLPMKNIWKHIRRDQKIEVFANGKPLRFRAGPGRDSPLQNRGVPVLTEREITELAAEGYLINKFGRVQKPRNESKVWAEKAFGNYATLNEVFERVTGKSLFAFYGAMLGFAREGAILAHDLDLDLAYFSEKESPAEVRMEFRTITEKLIVAGVHTEPFTYKLQFKGSGLSVTPCWISNGTFASTFGYVGDGYSVSRDDILPLKQAKHDRHDLLLPANPQAVAAYLYGHGWKYPDPGWKWLPEYKNRPVILAARLKEQDLRDLNALMQAEN